MKEYNAIFISDVHLGTDHTQHTKLLEFLKSLETEDGHGYRVKTLYLNGDIIDVTNFHRTPFFNHHLTVIKKLLRMKDKGVRLVYILGNHEMPLKSYMFEHDHVFNGIEFKQMDIHQAINGKKYLVIHGDQFDGMVRMHPFLYKLGDAVYILMNKINTLQNKMRKLFGMGEWSFAHWIKNKTKSAIKFVSKFETIIVEYAKRYDVDGVCSGHIHMPDDKMIGDVHYLNSGTWVELCSYIAEDTDGNIEVVVL